MEPSPSTTDRPARRSSLLPTSSVDWVLCTLALALIGYGGWRVIDRGGSLIGFSAMAVAFTILPYRIAGIIGGAAFLALGVYVLLQKVTLLGGVLVVLGIVTILERLRRDPGRT